MTNKSTADPTCGFSLFELLTVITIAGLIAAFAIPSFVPTMQSRSLTANSDEFEQSFQNARQTALVEDVVVDVEFLSAASEFNDSPKFSAYRFWKWLPSGDRIEIGKIHWLGSSFIFPEKFSSLIEDGATERSDPEDTQRDSELVEIVRFSIYPGGETDLPERSDNDNWHITITDESVTNELPDNFVCFQINQTNSHITRFQP
jgi:uncharacterized protein (TIGR02596 family)